MKHFILSFFSLASFFLNAQTTCVPLDNVVWVNVESWANDPWGNYTSERVNIFTTTQSDTVIKQKTYRKVFDVRNGNTYVGAVRADSLTCWYFSVTDTTERIVMTFDVEPGDTVKNVYFEGYVGEMYIDSVEWNNFTYGVPPRPVVWTKVPCLFQWVYGAGPTGGMFWNKPSGCISGHFAHLFCVSVNDTAVYPDFNASGCRDDISVEEECKEVQIYPNPTSDWIQLPEVVEDVKCYSRHGVVVSTIRSDDGLYLGHLPEGLYVLELKFQSGEMIHKKILVKP